MIVIVDYEKWNADKEFYNMKYLMYVMVSWEKHLRYFEKKYITYKTEKKKNFALGQINKARDNIDKIKLLIKNLL